MKNEQEKKAKMVVALNTMIDHADKGVSGFWVEDYEGCGNPEIFPEFKDGLKSGRLVQKEHYLCPWNTAILYGDGHGNISTGCYHSCSISKAKYLSPKEIKEVLIRFKSKMQNGYYDHPGKLEPLLAPQEADLIEERLRLERGRQEQECENARKKRLEKAEALTVQYPDYIEMFGSCYGEDTKVDTENGVIFFSPKSKDSVVGAEKMSYDEYLGVQINSLGKYRTAFANCYFNIPLEFMGQIEKLNAKRLCFKRVYVSGMFSDGEMFDDKEDHVWIDRNGLEEFRVGDCLSFGAEVYRYVKTGNGKLIDFGLRNLCGVKQIEKYDLPSDEDLMRQEINWIVCETCLLNEHCNRSYCMRNPKEMKQLKTEMLDMLKNNQSKEETT